MVIKGLRFLFPNLLLLHRINCFKTTNLTDLRKGKTVGHVGTSHWEVLCKNNCAKNLQNSREITCGGVSFLIMILGFKLLGLHVYYWNETHVKEYLWKFFKFFMNIFFYSTRPGDCLFHVQFAGFQSTTILKNYFTGTFQEINQNRT